jgi:hypothetical protein
MSFLDKIKNWVVAAIPSVISVAQKVETFLTTAASAADALMKGGVFAQELSSSPREAVEDARSREVAVQSRDQHLSRELSQMNHELAHLKQAVARQAQANKLALMITELRVAGEILRGISANIELHASNLRIHLHSIRNTSGLLSDVNRQRKAIKTMVGKINHIFNLLGKDGEKISGLDVERRHGDISIKDAYMAYDETRKNLIDEVYRFGKAIDDQWVRIDAVAKMARAVGQNRRIQDWLDTEVRPSLMSANESAKLIYENIHGIAPLEEQVVAELVMSE